MTTVLKGKVTRGEANWIASVSQGLPEGATALVMAPDWKKLRALAGEMCDRILAVPDGEVVVDLELEDAELQELINEVRQKKAQARDAEEAAREALGRAARRLTGQATVRDVAEMLGCSFQQVSKLAPKRRT